MKFTKLKKRYLTFEKLEVLSYGIFILLSVIASVKIGAYADASADTSLARLNFGKLFHIHTFLKGDNSSLQPFIAGYSYSVSLVIFGIPWIVAKLFRISSSLESPVALVIRDILTSLVALVGFYGINQWAKIVMRPSRSKIALLTPVLFPVWFGFAFMDSKDIPPVTGFIALLLLTAKLFDSKMNGQEKNNQKLKILRWTFFALVFTVGDRPATLFLVMPVFSYLIFRLLKFNRITEVRNLLLGLTLGITYLLLTNYYLLTNPIYWLKNSITTGSKFPWTGAVLSWGKLYRSPDIPRTYFLQMIFAQLPLVDFVIIIIGIFLFTSKFKYRWAKSPLSFRVALILFSGVILQTLLTKPILYDNARQTLFTWGLIAVILLWIFNEIPLKLLKLPIIKIILGCAVLVLFADQLTVFPYSYIYRNEIARQLPQGSFETDFWGLSGKELTSWVQRNSTLSKIENAKFSYIFQQSFDPFVHATKLTPVSIYDKTARYYAQIWRPALLPDMSAQCPIRFEVTRTFLFGKKEILGYVRKC